MPLPDIDSIDTYGGALSNYEPIVDPTTDEDASWRNAYVCNVAMMTRTALRAVRRFKGHATTPADPSTGTVHEAMWGNTNGVKPSVVHNATGIYDVTFPASVDDELGTAHDVNLRWAMAQVEQSDGTFRAAHAKVTGANTVRIYTYSGTTLNDLSDEVICVLVW